MFLERCWRASTFTAACESLVVKLPDKENLPIDVDVCPPVKVTAVRGRPQTKRYRSRGQPAHEGGTAVPRKRHKCGNCGLAGHHARTCPTPVDVRAMVAAYAARNPPCHGGGGRDPPF